MGSHVLPDGIGVGIGVTVAAKMTAGIVLTDVAGDIAGAFLTVLWIRRSADMGADRCLKGLYGHASRAVCANGFQRSAFSAGLYRHTVFFCDCYEGFRQPQLILHGYVFDLRIIPANLAVEVNKADDAGVSGTGEKSDHFGECLDVMRNGPFVV